MSGYVPVRLCDVPPKVRRAAARRLARQEPEISELVLAAAKEPSSITYYLPEDCRTMVEILCGTTSR